MNKTSEWRDGDVFFWRYKDGKENPYGYYCRAQKAIVRDGYLYDIFWAYINGPKFIFSGTTGGIWTRVQADRNLILEFRGNLDEFDHTADDNRRLYDDADVLDLRHSNSSQRQIYVRKDAKRSQAAMLEHFNYEIKKAEDDIKSAQWRLERLGADKAKIEAGELNEVYL